jgi:hypothetical protein
MQDKTKEAEAAREEEPTHNELGTFDKGQGEGKRKRRKRRHTIFPNPTCHAVPTARR